jgi:hypothetical protein
MAPSVGLQDVPNVPSADGKLFAYGGDRRSGSSHLVDSQNLRFSKFVHRIALALRIRLATTKYAFLLVVGGCSSVKMLRIITGRIIATMKHIQSIWNRPDQKEVTEPMRRLFWLIWSDINATVSHSLVSGEWPFKTSIATVQFLNRCDQVGSLAFIANEVTRPVAIPMAADLKDQFIVNGTSDPLKHEPMYALRSFAGWVINLAESMCIYAVRPQQAFIGWLLVFQRVQQKLVSGILGLHLSASQALGAGRTAVYAVDGLFHYTRMSRAQFVKQLPQGQLIAA